MVINSMVISFGDKTSPLLPFAGSRAKFYYWCTVTVKILLS